MTFSDIIVRLEKFFKVLTAAAIGLTIIEALIVLFIGIASSNIATPTPEVNRIWIGVLIALIVIYFFITFVKVWYNANFPSSITNELKAQKELEVLKLESERQKNISDLVVQTIARLNGATCALDQGDETHLCDMGVKDGVGELIRPVTSNMPFLLGTLNAPFMVGLYLEHYRTLTLIDGENWDQGVIVINDTLLEGENVLNKGLIQNDSLKDQELEIKMAIVKSFNNYEFVQNKFSGMNKEYIIICSPMPVACDEERLLGVLFIICPYIERIPGDLPTTLTIFNRVISNWVFRYNECINNRLEKMNK